MLENADTIAMLLSNFGFPVLVAIYLLIRFEKKIKLLISSNKKLRKYDYKYCWKGVIVN